MPSIPLKKPADLSSYADPANQAHLTVFLNTPTKSHEYLLVVFGTNSFGGIGELAHIKMSEDVFKQLLTRYPITNRANLMRSDNIAVSEAQQLLTAHWPLEPAPDEATT